MLFIFHGEDDFTRAEQVRQLRASLGDPQFADLNTTVLDGRRLTVGELRHHADAIPFLAAKRLVVIEGLLARLDPRAKKGEDSEEQEREQESNPELKEQLLEYLPALPDTTILVFVENKTLAKNNPILKYAEKEKKRVTLRHFAPPSSDALPEWIIDHTEKKGGTIEFSAANDLALFVGAELRALDNEIEKLLTYRRGETIRREDVQTLVAPAQQGNIFELVDALGQRKTQVAIELLNDQLRHNAEPLYLLAMITRQYRMLLQVRDLAARGVPQEQIAKQLGLHPFVGRKVLDQSRHYSVEELEEIMTRLLETDVGLKTSRLEPVLALDLLVVELTRK